MLTKEMIAKVQERNRTVETVRIKERIEKELGNSCEFPVTFVLSGFQIGLVKEVCKDYAEKGGYIFGFNDGQQYAPSVLVSFS